MTKREVLQQFFDFHMMEAQEFDAKYPKFVTIEDDEDWMRRLEEAVDDQ